MKAFIISHDGDRQLVWSERWAELEYDLTFVRATTPSTYETDLAKWPEFVVHDRYHSHLLGGRPLLPGEQSLRLSFMNALSAAIECDAFPCLLLEADCVPFVRASDIPTNLVVEIMRPYNTLRRIRVDRNAPLRSVSMTEFTDLHPNPTACNYFWGSHATVIKDERAASKLRQSIAHVALPTDIIIWYKALTRELHVLRCLQDVFVQAVHKSTIS
jgi:hypothetical protein